MFLYIRIALYVFFGWLAGAGIGSIDQTGQVFSIEIDRLAEWLVSGLGIVGTFAASRVAKRMGGKT